MWNKLLILMFVLIFLSVSPVYSQNILDDIFAPFEGLDIAQTYDKYNTVIDFILYLIVLAGASC